AGYPLSPSDYSSLLKPSTGCPVARVVLFSARRESMPEEKEAAPPVAKPPSQGRLLVVILAVFASSVCSGVVSWVLVSRATKPVKAAEAQTDGENKESMADVLEKGGALPLDPFVVNLADADAARYLRIKVSLMVDDKASLSHVTENQALQLKLRDVIL